MLEILFLVYFGKRLATMARDKGRSGGWGALVLLWVLGEIVGFVAAGMVGITETIAAYPLALVGAALGALTAWLIVRSLGPLGADPSMPMPGGVLVENQHYDPNNPFSPPRRS